MSTGSSKGFNYNLVCNSTPRVRETYVEPPQATGSMA